MPQRFAALEEDLAVDVAIIGAGITGLTTAAQLRGAGFPNAVKDFALSSGDLDLRVGADALAIVTEWKEFRSPDFADLKARLRTPAIFDGRNMYDPASVREAGLEYHAIGRP